MTDTSTRAARDDLAFLKAVTEDRGPLPGVLGGHMLGVGAAYAPNLVLVWAIYDHRVPWPEALMWGTWLPGTAVWLVIWLVLQGRMKAMGAGGFGPSARVFGAAWSAVGLMTAATVGLLMTATLATGQTNFIQLWPAFAFVLWGGSWSAIALVRRRWWLGLVALASFAFAIGAAALLAVPEVWLLMAAGLLLVFALPGAVILRQASRAA